MATILQRAIGAFIDSLVFAPLTILLLVTRSTHQELRPLTGGGSHLVTVTDPRPPAVALLIMVPHAIYLIVAIGVWGRTVGQWAMGLRVVALDGTAAGWDRAVRRWVVPAIPSVITAFRSMVLFTFAADALIYGWMLWDANRQGLHDKFAGDVVIRTRA